ncbi:hypothetical protein ACSNOH_01420 [Streptomyces sp. URMC 127]|uniref:hypothetical protein n=1 Tax=Streptomyces sp. URMC 127 TaxID=3423402 RepID=UPI003F1E0428
MQIVVAGQGYVGLPLAVRAAEVGHRVVSYDVDTDRIKRLTVGDSYVEDVASSRLRAVLDSGAYSATADAAALAGFDIAVISMLTPLSDGVPDLTYVESCARTLGEHLRPARRWSWVHDLSGHHGGAAEERICSIVHNEADRFEHGLPPSRVVPPVCRPPRGLQGLKHLWRPSAHHRPLPNLK